MKDFIYMIKFGLGLVNNEEFVKKLKCAGIKIGEGTYFFEPASTKIDTTRPYLLEIGSYTKITRGVVILTHDYSLSVLRRVYGEFIGEGAKTIIGDNVFIGINSIILMGTHIGNNVIIGAGSVVKGNIPDNVVVAGNPAKIICTLDEHYEKRKLKTVLEAKECARAYYDYYGIRPKPKDLSGFKFLFSPRDKKYLLDNSLDFKCNGDNPKEIEEMFFASSPVYENFDVFLDEALNENVQ